ncbi:MAG TPA: hypothetical protein VIB07_02640 [Nitrososphaera sp.]|jgi:hypothetical protein
MDNLRQLLAVIVALTLLLSAVSGTNPNYFAGYVAFADDEDDDDDNSGSSHDDDNGEEEEHEESEENDQKTVATFGTNSKVELEVEDHVKDDKSVKADLEVETGDGDLDDAEYAVMFNCTTPDVEKLFDGKLVVEDGDGDFEGELLLVNGTTYEGCKVGIGDDLTVSLPTFMVNVGMGDAKDDDDDEEKEKDRENGRDDDDDEEKDDEEDDDDDGDRRYHEHDRRVGLELEDDGVEIKVKVRGLNMSDGTYDAVLTCEDPKTEMTIPGAFEVEDGEGELEAEIELANGTYNGCELTVGDDVLASFRSFTISEENDDDEVSDKRKDKRKDIISRLDGKEIHKRRMNANPASPGDYDPGWNYTLIANGTAEHSAIDEDSAANVTIDMAVWKSNRALILMSVLDGTVAVGAEEYEVELGYALYSVNHNAMRLFAFVSDDSGGIYKLKLRGHAAEDSEFPNSAGESIEMRFDGNSGPGRNSLNHDWELMLEGTIEAK